MCGIAATFRYAKRGPVDRDELRTMRDCMEARGPDDEGLWVSNDERVGLAHRRLSIIDLSPRGAQPMATCDDRGHPGEYSVALLPAPPTADRRQTLPSADCRPPS